MKRLMAARIFAAGALIAAITGCSSADERLCKVSLKASLLNPETAQFYDFKTIDIAMFMQGLSDGLEAKHGRSPPNKAQAAKMLTEKFEQAPDIKLYSVRVKADGVLGNKITKMQVCIVNEGECSCQNAS